MSKLIFIFLNQCNALNAKDLDITDKIVT